MSRQGLVLILLLTAPCLARTHKLEAEYRILPEGRVQIEAWYDITGESAKGARVEVLGPRDVKVTTGRMDNRGIFTFTPKEPQALRVVVSLAGHRAEVLIRAEELSQPSAAVDALPDHSHDDAESHADRQTKVNWRDVLTGLNFVLALAAFVMSWRNSQRRSAVGG